MDEPIVLYKLTTIYDEHEDRLVLLGEVSQGVVIRCWLTRRLLGRVVTMIRSWLEQHSSEKRLLTALTGWEAAPVARKGKSAAREVTWQVKGEWLLKSVDLHYSQQHAMLVFRGMNDEAASIRFSASQMRQWLVILRRVCVGAEWGVAWPKWTETKDAVPPERVVWN